MLKKLGTLTIKKTDDYYGNVVKTLEKAGFKILKEEESYYEVFYIIAEEIKGDDLK